jgi:hypothetical protein
VPRKARKQPAWFDLILSVDLSSLLLKLTFLRGGVNKKKGRKKETQYEKRKIDREKDRIMIVYKKLL